MTGGAGVALAAASVLNSSRIREPVPEWVAWMLIVTLVFAAAVLLYILVDDIRDRFCK